MKPVFIKIALLSVLLVGCAQGKQKTLLPYHEKGSMDFMQVDYLDSETMYRASRFSEGLCVIPSDYDQKKDGAFDASSVVRMDLTDLSIVYSSSPYKKLYPASITKIVTALIVLKYGDLDDEVTVGHNAANILEPGAKKCGLKVGDKINMDVLLHSFLIYSGNDAGVAIAEHMEGSVEEFADRMNEEALNLGAVGSHFVNPHGLHDDDHYTTAYDIYLFMNELKNYDEFLEIIGKKSYQAAYEDKDGNKVKKVFESTNQFLTGQIQAPKGVTVVGGKTGTTEKAGSCLALLTKNKDGHDNISIILKAQGGTLFPQMKHLIGMSSGKPSKRD